MWTNGSRSDRSTPANARRTGNPSPSRPLGAGLTPRTRRNRAPGATGGTRSRVVGSSTVIAGMSLLEPPGCAGYSAGPARSGDGRSFGASDTLLPDPHREGVLLDLDLEARLVREREHDPLDDRRGVAEPDALAALRDLGDGAVRAGVEEGRFREVDRDRADASAARRGQQARGSPVELPREVQDALAPFDAQRRRGGEPGRARRHRERVGAFGAFERLVGEPILVELAEQERVPAVQHAELVPHVLELPPDLGAPDRAQAPRTL